jgi:hypothetical protein
VERLICGHQGACALRVFCCCCCSTTTKAQSGRSGGLSKTVTLASIERDEFGDALANEGAGTTREAVRLSSEDAAAITTLQRLPTTPAESLRRLRESVTSTDLGEEAVLGPAVWDYRPPPPAPTDGSRGWLPKHRIRLPHGSTSVVQLCGDKRCTAVIRDFLATTEVGLRGRLRQGRRYRRRPRDGPRMRAGGVEAWVMSFFSFPLF